MLPVLPFGPGMLHSPRPRKQPSHPAVLLHALRRATRRGEHSADRFRFFGKYQPDLAFDVQIDRDMATIGQLAEQQFVSQRGTDRVLYQP